MKRLAAGADPPGDYPVLDRVPPLQSDVKIKETEPPSDELHVQKAELLGNGGLVDFAVENYKRFLQRRVEAGFHRKRRGYTLDRPLRLRYRSDEALRAELFFARYS